MITRYQNRVQSLRITAYFFITLGAFLTSTYSLRSDSTSESRLDESVNISIGDHQISLSKGTPVQILQTKDQTATVSLILPDGSSLITQIPVKTLRQAAKDMHAPTEKKFTDLSQTFRFLTNFVNSSVQTSPIDISPKTSPIGNTASSNLQQANPNEIEHPDFSSGISLASLDTHLPQKRFTALTGSFYIVINSEAVPVKYSLPMENRHLAESASNLVFDGPYPNQKIELATGFASDVVEKLGCTVFTISFKADPIDLSDPKTAYWNEKSSCFNAVLSARDEILKGFGLKRRKLILFGDSGGGGMALNFAGAFPDEVEAVATQGANLAPDVEQSTSVKWLIINNRGDTNSAITKPFYDHIRALGDSALYCETSQERGRLDYHAGSQQASDLMYSFISGILDQRSLSDLEVTDIHRLWPYASPTDPLKKYAIVKTLDLSEEAINSKSFDLLPSAPFAAYWAKIVSPTQDFASPDGMAKIKVTFPSISRPLGTVIYYDIPSYTNIARIVEDIHSLAEHGYVVISPSGIPQTKVFAEAAVKWIRTQTSYDADAVHLLGYGAAGADLVSILESNNEVRVKSINLVDLQNTSIDASEKAAIEDGAKSCGMYSFFIYPQNGSSGLTQISNDLVTNESRERGCCELFGQAKITHEMVDSDQQLVSTDRIALDVDKTNKQALIADQKRLKQDQKQASDDEKEALIEEEQMETQSLQMVKDLIDRCNPSVPHV
jgi:pimeloyl-ACP methyl ester carboxylesterase